MKGYFALRLPGYIYLVGAPEGWSGPSEDNKAHYEEWKLLESDNAIGSKVYYGEFDVPAGKFQFRFYTALTGWDKDSYGIQDKDEPKEITMTKDIYDGKIVKGKGSYQISDWPGGKVKMTVKFEKVG